MMTRCVILDIVVTRMHHECVIAYGEHLMQRFAGIIFRPRLRRMCIDDMYTYAFVQPLGSRTRFYVIAPRRRLAQHYGSCNSSRVAATFAEKQWWRWEKYAACISERAQSLGKLLFYRTSDLSRARRKLQRAFRRTVCPNDITSIYRHRDFISQINKKQIKTDKLNYFCEIGISLFKKKSGNVFLKCCTHSRCQSRCVQANDIVM